MSRSEDYDAMKAKCLSFPFNKQLKSLEDHFLFLFFANFY